eukprot:3813833-Pyramimonas_sp.AAC.1
MQFPRSVQRSWPHKELQRRPQWRPRPSAAHPSHVSRPHNWFHPPKAPMAAPTWRHAPYRHTLRMLHGLMRRSPEGDTRNDGTHNCTWLGPSPSNFCPPRP